jgi:uncharacterized protein YjbI with pentapeptide repeats
VNVLNSNLRADCENCFGLCCVALPYAKSADFAFDKEEGVPCRNLQTDFRCSVHQTLRKRGFRGCAVYECFGAGQKVSHFTFKGMDWRDNSERAKEMFKVFPIMQQLHEMLSYLDEALHLKEALPIRHDLRAVYQEIEDLTKRNAEGIMQINVSVHRASVNEQLLRTSELVRSHFISEKHHHLKMRGDYIGAKFRNADLKGANLRGALLIAADLQNADMRWADLIGADLRDADLRGADLTGSIFLTQAQVNSAKGNSQTRLPESLIAPDHWLEACI